MDTIKNESIDLVIADPPYWKVVSEKWDYMWRTEDDYLEWSKQWLEKVFQKLRIGGSFYLFGYFRMLSLLVPILQELGFSLRQQIILDKGMKAVAGRATKNYKMFPNVTESILFLVKDNKDFSKDMFDENNTTVICIDIQEKLVNMLQNSETIEKNTSILMKTANILNLDTIITEQYPKGLGSTIETIKGIKDFTTIEKTTFSVLKTPEFVEKFKSLKNKNILIFGIETHICVLQSVIDILESNYNVFLVSDCCASRDENNHNIALDVMKQKGAYIITLEIALFNLLKSSKHPNFKEIQKFIK